MEHQKIRVLELFAGIGACSKALTNLGIEHEIVDAVEIDKYALEFCKKAIELAPKTAMFLKLTFLEGAKRQPLFKSNPPRYVAVCVNRVQCAINGDKDMFSKSSAACYAWFIWERGYTGRPEILWITKEAIIHAN